MNDKYLPQYPEVCPMKLDKDGGYYFRHVEAMTKEGLHSKSDIAEQLGWRDREIDSLRAALEAALSQGEAVAPNTNLAQELLERHTVAINVAVEDGPCFMVSEQGALDAIRSALSHATSIDMQVGLPPLPPVDGYDKRIQGHYSAQQMRDYALAALAATGKQSGSETEGSFRARSSQQTASAESNRAADELISDARKIMAQHDQLDVEK